MPTHQKCPVTHVSSSAADEIWGTSILDSSRVGDRTGPRSESPDLIEGHPAPWLVQEGPLRFSTLESKTDSRVGLSWLLKGRTTWRRSYYLMMTTFMLHGVRLRVRGKVCAPRLVVVGGAQVLVPDGSGKVPVGEPDWS